MKYCWTFRNKISACAHQWLGIHNNKLSCHLPIVFIQHLWETWSANLIWKGKMIWRHLSEAVIGFCTKPFNFFDPKTLSSLWVIWICLRNSTSVTTVTISLAFALAAVLCYRTGVYCLGILNLSWSKCSQALYGRGYNHYCFAGDEIMLPCEFCEELYPAEDLILHQV